jgi:hypothetical protein
MDPITTAIVAAISAGVTSSMTAVGKEAILDAYKGIKSAIKSKFGKDNNISKTITDLEADPKSKGYQLLLAEHIATAKANQVPDILKITQKLTEALQSTETGRKAIIKFQVDARNSQVGVIGDRAKVEGGIHFGETKR